MVTAVVTVSAGIATLIVTGVSGRTTRPPGASVAAAAPTPSPTAAPGSMLLTCEFANWGELVRSWRAGSLKVGPLWLYGRASVCLPGPARCSGRQARNAVAWEAP